LASGIERREKHRITLVSVGAAFALAALKLVAGLLTGSLGLISEALHSGLDLIASVITFFSVRIAGRPADEDHPYGHGRVENLSAAIQALLLLMVASMIIYESVRRLFFDPAEVRPSAWAFAVLGLSIVVDYWRSRMLARAARRYHSSAMEADALNFRADMWSSGVVILGLALVALGERTGRLPLLARADALAALVVALAVVALSFRLALRAVSVLVDRAPANLRERMTEAAASVPGVVGSQPVRLRESGSRLFADIVVTVPRTASLAEAHTITERVEERIRDVEPRTETVVHVEPVEGDAETAADRLRAVALELGMRTHHERAHRVADRLEASLHLEVEPSLTLGEAHAQAHRLARAAQEDNPLLGRVDTHIEVADTERPRGLEAGRARPEMAAGVRLALAEEGAAFHELRLYGTERHGWDAVVHCGFPPGMNVAEVHRRTERLEQRLRERLPELEQVVIHAEPAGPLARTPDGSGGVARD
jgi:cation diffusion facilitator family transporter